MHTYIAISTLNDFIFCPYSIYLHNVYMGGDEELVHAVPQARGMAAHAVIDEKRYGGKKDEIVGLGVYCDELGIAGKIDVYRVKEKLLIERKYQLNAIYQGQIYQLWAQYFCMVEMGYEVEELAFYAISTNKMFPVLVPTDEDKKELADFISAFKRFNPEDAISTNQNKCTHCIYCALCDKTDVENVYA
jgi:CRISPR-associated protein Cas4